MQTRVTAQGGCRRASPGVHCGCLAKSLLPQRPVVQRLSLLPRHFPSGETAWLVAIGSPVIASHEVVPVEPAWKCVWTPKSFM